MKTKIKLMAVTVICTMLLTSICSAAPFDSFSINDDTNELTISGTIDGAKKGDSITVQILKQGMAPEEIADAYTGDTLKTDFVLFTQVPANSNGGYSETVSMKTAGQGFYWIRVNGKDAAEIYYSSKADREAVVKAILDNCSLDTEAASVSYLKENFKLTDKRSLWVKSFDINDEVVFTATEDGLFKVFLNEESRSAFGFKINFTYILSDNSDCQKLKRAKKPN